MGHVLQVLVGEKNLSDSAELAASWLKGLGVTSRFGPFPGQVSKKSVSFPNDRRLSWSKRGF